MTSDDPNNGCEGDYLEGDLASKIIFIISPLDLVALSCDLLVDQPIWRKSGENVPR